MNLTPDFAGLEGLLDHSVYNRRPDVAGDAEPCANWPWLVDRSVRGDLLVLGHASNVGVVANRFSRVRDYQITEFASSRKIPYPDELFDYVVVALSGDRVAERDTGARSAELWSESFRVLRRGGGLMVHGANPMEIRSWFPRFAQGFSRWLQHKRLPGLLRRVGFRGLRAYYCSGMDQSPWQMLPADGRSLAAWERFIASPSVRRLARVALSRAGVHWLLHQEFMLVLSK